MYEYYHSQPEKLKEYGISLGFLMGSITSSLFNAICQFVILHMEATSGKKSLMSYIAMCFVG